MLDLPSLAQNSRAAARRLAQATTDEKNAALQRIADQLWAEKDAILAANQADLAEAQANGLSPALLDRLMLNEARLSGIVSDLRSVAALPDPVGEVFEQQVLPNGLRARKVRVPLGVLAVIYEARPNVTVDVTGLGLKSGNCVILRGGSETIHSNRALVAAIRRGLGADGDASEDTPLTMRSGQKDSAASAPRFRSILPDAVQLISDTDRQLVFDLLQLDSLIDMVIPRGGAGLHDFCRKNSRIPVITGGIGICHLFVDETADLPRSIEVIRNAKIQRPSVCNALDTVLVHQAAARLLPALVARLAADGVTFRADPPACAILSESSGLAGTAAAAVQPAGPRDFDTEWLSLVLGLKVVSGLDEAVEHIAAHSTGHSDGILTADPAQAARFVAAVDSAAVYVNASTRFTDGSQLGLGAEVAISTQRLHARGPMGLRELTSYKWVVEGDYHVRG